MNPETLQEIFHAFITKKLTSSDLLYYLSRYDLKHEMTRESFKKRYRVHRTIITEIKRYLDLPESYRSEAWSLLQCLYIKDYLYYCAAQDLSHQSLDFAAYIESLIDTHEIIKEQYNKLEEKEEFWDIISLLQHEMQKT